MTDGSLDWLWPAAERAGVPVALAAALFLPTVGQIAERHPGLKLIVDHMAVPPGSQRRVRLSLPARAAGARQIPQRRGQGDRPARLCGRLLSVPQLPSAPAPRLRRVRANSDVLGHRHHPDAVFLAAMRDGVHRRDAVAQRPRPRPGHGRSHLTWVGGASPAGGVQIKGIISGQHTRTLLDRRWACPMPERYHSIPSLVAATPAKSQRVCHFRFGRTHACWTAQLAILGSAQLMPGETTRRRRRTQ